MYSSATTILLTASFAFVNTQQIYIPARGPTIRPFCSATHAPSEPKYRFSSFSFTLNESVRTATSIPAPTITSTFALPYGSLSHLVPDLSTTTWGSWNPNDIATATDVDNPYGTAAWSALWVRANLTNFTATGIYTTTVSPTPVPSSELVLPPPDYFEPTDCYNFPEGFMFGVAGSAAQIEGAIAQEGRAPTLMEVLETGSNARDYITNENYYLYKQDIERIASMGVKYYSFSVVWTRILPFALPGTPVNQAGVDHYNDLINFVLEKGMTPIVTLLHFDTLLQFFANLSTVHDDALVGYVNGGYQNSTFEDAFVHYGKVVLTHYADRVPLWISFNEPLIYSDNGKSINSVVKAHARLWHFYHEELDGSGRFGIKLNDNFGVPRDPKNASDVFAANWFNEFQLATFCNPLLLGIDYSTSYKATILDYVPLNTSDLVYLKGTADFLGIDPYTATVVSAPSYGIASCAANSSDPLFPYCVNQSAITTNGWNIGYRSYSYVYLTPTYLREYLNYLYNTWRTPVFVTEFGFPVFGEADKAVIEDMLFDTPRSIYYLSFMSEILKSIWEDGVHVIGALA